MPSQSRLQFVGVAAVIGILSAGGGWLQHLREDRYPAPPPEADSLDITSGPVLKHLTAGYNTVAADLYWIRAIQYYGGNKLAMDSGAAGSSMSPARPSADYPLLYPLLDLTTTLDPNFNIAYRFGEIFLAEPSPGGAGRPDLAIALLEKGLRSRPDKWEYMQDIGFVHYWWQQDYKGAAEWFARAGNVPGAPWWLKSLAANTLAEGGDRESSRAMWEALRQSADIDWLRHDAERRLMQLQALDQIDALQAAVDRFGVNTGRPAGDWLSLVRAGVLGGIPADPVRTPYEIDAAGRVRLSERSSLYPLPNEPKGLGAPPS